MSPRILLVRTDRIGDTVLTLPAVSVLREHYPQAFLAFLANPYTEPLVLQYQGLDQVISYHPGGRHQGWQGHRALAEELKSRHFDAAVLFYPRPELTLTLRGAGIPRIIGTGYRWYSFLFSERIFEHRKDCVKHEAEYNLGLLTPLVSCSLPRPRFQFEYPEVQENKWRKTRNDWGLITDYVIVHAGSGASATNLTPEQYRFLVQHLLVETSWTVLLTGSEAEVEMVNELMEGLPEKRVLNVAGRFGLGELMRVIREARLLISSSTGTLHMANAAGTPLLGFFCPAVPHTPRRWGPYDQQEWVVTPDLGGPLRCQHKKCPHGGCLKHLKKTEMAESLERRLQHINF